jgi:hypothetical protein
MKNFFADDFLLYRTFGCAVEQKAFNSNYKLLSNEEQKRLNRVAVRLWMIFQLRYRFQYERNFALRGQDWLQLTYREKPSLEIYLLATCLDTLAGKPSSYKDFDKWLEDQAIEENVSVTQVSKLFKDWRQEYGVNQTLKALFDRLPCTLITWLSANVQFRKYSGTPNLNRKLFKYIFQQWRNPFTHGSTTNNTWGTDTDIELPPSSENKWWSHSPDGYLACRSGLDVATILRVIIYAVVLTRLEFEITSKHLDTYVKALSKLDAFYKFKWEMRYNVSLLQFWANYDGLPMILHPLNLDQTQRLNAKLKISPVAMERELSEVLAVYEDKLEGINAQIADFNATYPCEPFEISNTYSQALFEFLAQQVTTDVYQAALQIPRNSQIMSIDLFVREVFLYWVVD